MGTTIRKQPRKFLSTPKDAAWKSRTAPQEDALKATKRRQRPTQPVDPRDTLAPRNDVEALGHLYLQGSTQAGSATAPNRQAMLTAGVLLTTVIAGGQAGQMLAIGHGPAVGPLPPAAPTGALAATSSRAALGRGLLQQIGDVPAAPAPSEVITGQGASGPAVEPPPAPLYPYSGMTYEEVASALPFDLSEAGSAEDLTYGLAANILWLDQNDVPDALEGTLNAAWSVAKKLNITDSPSSILGQAEYQATQTATGFAEDGVSAWSEGDLEGTVTATVASPNQGTSTFVAADNTTMPAIPAVNQVLSAPTSFYQSSYQPESYAWHAGTARLFGEDGVQPGDLAQNNLGDCTLSAMIASVAMTNPEIFQNNIKSLGNGVYAVTLYDNQGNPSVIKVNDRFPILPNGSLAYIANQNWRYGGIPNNPILWPMLVEKACAIQWSKTFGQATAAYINLDGNKGFTNPIEMYQMLTGQSANLVDVADADTNVDTIRSALAAGSPIIVGTSSDNNDVVNGVDGGHSYTVVGVTNDNQVILRNPWGGLNPIEVPDILLNYGKDQGFFRISMDTLISDFAFFTISNTAAGAPPRLNLTDAAGTPVDLS